MEIVTNSRLFGVEVETDYGKIVHVIKGAQAFIVSGFFRTAWGLYSYPRVIIMDKLDICKLHIVTWHGDT